ncbi:unnamed protein product [Rotaria sp. Silwood1]|nr:unnamed protein product [Rotaria sp. Silwood1]CAF3392686.1 unnamed protein product [Rotaria sp. Silwood1]CAF4641063.1 unnamed protein product [Rotaria sp. Silwood1]
MILKTLIRKARKPKSANRKCCRVHLANGIEVIAYIQDDGHNLQKHYSILIRGRTNDLSSVHYKAVCGKLDCNLPIKRQATVPTSAITK